MHYFLNFILTSLLVAYSQATDPELKGGFFEGDMLIDLQRNGVINPARRWPNGIVRYKISPVFDINHSIYILKAMRQIEINSCIRFFHVTDTTEDFIRFTGKETGCNAKVGYTGMEQYVNLEVSPLDSGCFRIGTIIHEILHALGFYHQHSTTDRDNYIKIVFDNVQDSMMGNFKKYSSDVVTDFGVEYDYGSVLHYGKRSFSKNGQDTIIPLKGDNIQIGQRDGLSAGDIKKLNKMYNC